ncbi:MAG: hypothetical protein AVDCRST_MAG59-4262, partial [uncultured Thermomicrobiales bacterium]
GDRDPAEPCTRPPAAGRPRRAVGLPAREHAPRGASSARPPARHRSPRLPARPRRRHRPLPGANRARLPLPLLGVLPHRAGRDRHRRQV